MPGPGCVFRPLRPSTACGLRVCRRQLRARGHSAVAPASHAAAPARVSQGAQAQRVGAGAGPSRQGLARAEATACGRRGGWPERRCVGRGHGRRQAHTGVSCRAQPSGLSMCARGAGAAEQRRVGDEARAGCGRGRGQACAGAACSEPRGEQQQPAAPRPPQPVRRPARAARRVRARRAQPAAGSEPERGWPRAGAPSQPAAPSRVAQAQALAPAQAQAQPGQGQGHQAACAARELPREGAGGQDRAPLPRSRHTPPAPHPRAGWRLSAAAAASLGAAWRVRAALGSVWPVCVCWQACMPCCPPTNA